MNPDAKPREERKRAHGGEPPGPEAKKAALPAPEPKAAVSLPPPSTFLANMQTMVNATDADYLQEKTDKSWTRMYDVLVMFTRPVNDNKDGNACRLNYVILDVHEHKGSGVRAGFSTAPYETKAVEKQRAYFTMENKLPPGVAKTVLHQVVRNKHGYNSILTPYTYDEHPKPAQKNMGKGLGSKKQVGALYPGMEMLGFVFLDGDRADPFEKGDKKEIDTWVVGRLGMVSQRRNKVNDGYGLKIAKVEVYKSAPTAALFENVGAYYNDIEDVEDQTKRLLARKNFEDNEVEDADNKSDNRAFESITNKHSQYSRPFIVIDSGRKIDGVTEAYSVCMGADGATMELVLHSTKSRLDRKPMNVQVHKDAFANAGGVDMHWVCDFYRMALEAGKALVVVSYDERALKGDGAHPLQCLVVVREEALFAPPSTPTGAFDVPDSLLKDLACPDLAAKQLRDPLVIMSADGGDAASKYCAWLLQAAPGCKDSFYAFAMKKSLKRNEESAAAVLAPGCSAMCALREIRRLPGTVFYVVRLCRVDAAAKLSSVVQCALLEPAVMPAVPRVISAGAASSSVGLMGDLGL